MVLVRQEGVGADGAAFEAGDSVGAVADDLVDDELTVDAAVVREHPAQMAATLEQAGPMDELILGDHTVQYEPKAQLRVGRALGEVHQTVVEVHANARVTVDAQRARQAQTAMVGHHLVGGAPRLDGDGCRGSTGRKGAGHTAVTVLYSRSKRVASSAIDRLNMRLHLRRLSLLVTQKRRLPIPRVSGSRQIFGKQESGP
jgi:hypothetical protein